MENFSPVLIKLLRAPMKYLFRTFSFAFIGRKVLPPPSNLHYSFGQLCKLKWTWNPPEGMNSGCDLEYCSEILINGIPQENRVRFVVVFVLFFPQLFEFHNIPVNVYSYNERK